MGNTKILAEAKNLWMKLNLRGAILTSLSLQVFLILFAPNRKKWSNWWFVTLMWSAYLVADSVAVYALGLIAKAQIIGGTSDSEVDAYGDLLAFWAPFLLLHLGGPDTITAFALEDNELWGRHLLNLLFQLGTASYVFYQSLPSNKLIVPTILMFIGGTIKYVARTRALYLVSSSKFRDSLLPPADPGEDYPKFLENYFASLEYATDFIRHVLELSLPEDQRLFPHVRAENKKNLDDRTVIETAFFYFTTFKGLLVDLIFSFQELNRSRDFFFSRTVKDAFRVIEAELNFFYDVLYTKAAVVHCPKGYLFRAISIGSIVTAFACFHVLNKHGFHEYDVQITYALLLGAVGLEFVALGMLICSDWTIARIGTSGEHSRSLFQGSIFIEFLLKFKFESSPFALDILHARWSKSVCQYNLIDSQLRKRPKGIDLLLCYIPLGELFDDLTSGRVKYSEKLGELIFEELTRKASIANDYQSIKEMCAARGKWALENTKTRRDCKDLLPSIRDVDYGESLLLWHLATELCHNTDTDESTNHHRESSKVLSDYMLYLMIKQPGMMSAVAGIVQIRFRDTCADADRFFNKFHESKTEITNRDACQNLLDVRTDTNFKPADVRGDKSKSVLFDACILAKELRKFGGTKWVIVSEVWVELLAYAAIHCRPYVHAQQLSKGGELVTLVWLLMVHLGLSEQFQIRFV